MNLLNLWTLRQTKTFKSQLEKFLKKYYKKDVKGKEKFLSLFRDFLYQLTLNPNIPNSKLEPAPKGSLEENEELRKYYFNLPNYKGSLSQGRLIYKVNRQKKEIVLICIYTHNEFEKRPPDKDLKRFLSD
ncbi:MAG: hypothetical protein DSY53_04380 [Persephonella sp.]|nr:MAG: hypothetical protein DSY53_04380 [Persephonella sp.]